MFGENRKLITLRCCVCKTWVAIRVDPDDLERHLRHGVFVQDAFIDRDGTPYLSPSERTFPCVFGRLFVVLGSALPERQTGLLIAARKEETTYDNESAVDTAG